MIGIGETHFAVQYDMRHQSAMTSYLAVAATPASPHSLAYSLNTSSGFDQNKDLTKTIVDNTRITTTTAAEIIESVGIVYNMCKLFMEDRVAAA